MEVIRSTWLTRRPHDRGGIVAAWTVFLMLVGSIFYWRDFFHASAWMSASYNTVFTQGEYWRLWTTLFAHADMGHLLSNSLLLFVMGYFLSGYYGVLVFPVAAIFCGGITNAIVLQSYHPDVNLIGVSGVVYWMGATWLLLYLFVDKQRSYTQRTLRAIGVALGVFMPSTAFDPQVSYRAHLVGFVVGLFFAAIYYRLKRDQFTAAIVTEIVPEEPDLPLPTPEQSESRGLN